jgi:hypothetical protein
LLTDLLTLDALAREPKTMYSHDLKGAADY